MHSCLMARRPCLWRDVPGPDGGVVGRARVPVLGQDRPGDKRKR